MSWVVIWATPHDENAAELDESSWIMVRHRTRGWELPGGKIRHGETIEDAATREFNEETGMSGQLMGINSKLIDGGHVAWIIVPKSANPFSWESPDDSIMEVGWCILPPDDLHWGVEELRKIAIYWSNAITSSS